MLLELPKKSGGSEPQGRIPPSLVAEAVGEAAAHDLTVFTEVDDIQSIGPPQWRCVERSLGPYLRETTQPRSTDSQGRTIPVYLLGRWNYARTSVGGSCLVESLTP